MAKRPETDAPAVVPFTPKVSTNPPARRLLRALARDLAEIVSTEEDADTAIEGARRRFISRRGEWARVWRDPLVAAANVLADLARTGWAVRVSRSGISVERPVDEALEHQRDQHRRNLVASRGMQLREPSVQTFVQGMERPRPGPRGDAVSIFSLMRDGRQLVEQLASPQRIDGDAVGSFRHAVRPYLQFIEDKAVCPTTGMRLSDIWRYFRHTWTNPYQTIPGRSMSFLVRDAAAPYHAVMGIGAISSAAVQMTSRDRFIGWQAENFIESVRQAPTTTVAQWIWSSLATFRDEIYITDFLRDEFFTLAQLETPDDDLIEALEIEAEERREEHRRLMRSGEYKRKPPPDDYQDEYWEEQAKMPLFRSKRAAELADLLQLQRAVRSAFGTDVDAVGLARLLDRPGGAAVVGTIARKAKAKTVGVCIADLTVCGAVAPYNELLAGKLVAMLASSPHVVEEYRRRYGSAASVIASSMAGRTVRRTASLVFISTTSLYGVRPSQYDNIAVPCSRIGGRSEDRVRYIFLENTQGKGSFHFSDTTLDSLATLLRQSTNGLAVNSVFGEGANPKLRKLRDGLEYLGLPADELITHGIDKLVYVVPLVRNARDYLLGLTDKPEYLFSLDSPVAAESAIADWWAERWAVKRLARPETLDRIARHTLVRPVRHAARVELPDMEVDAPPLFDW